MTLQDTSVGAQSSGNGQPEAASAALLFERDSAREVPDWDERLPRLRRTSILWVDLVRPEREQVERLAAQLDLSGETVEQLLSADGGPRLADRGAYLQVTAFAPRGEEARELRRVDCLVGERWVVTMHDAPLDALDVFRERTKGSGDVGQLEGLEFLATLLEWVLGSYLMAFEGIELELEQIDTLAMRHEFDSTEDVLERLVVLRRETGRLRRALVSHRETILALTRPELESILVAESVAEQLNKRINYRRALKTAAETSMAAGAKGIKILVAGRLGGAEMSRVGEIRKGRVPCTTLRAQVDFGTAVAKTTFGTLGVKVWIFKGEYGPGETTAGLLPVRTVTAERAV